MNKSYVLIYSPSFGDRSSLTGVIDGMSEVLNWRYDIDNVFYLVSDLSARDLAQRLREETKSTGRFLLVEATSNKQGWLPKETWSFLNEKRGVSTLSD